eukprot:3466795-Pleurochrysis_carterae.AAC.1
MTTSGTTSSIWCETPYKSRSPTSTSRYGAEPRLKHGLHYRGNLHHVKHSCLSDTSDRVVEDIPYIPLSA